ncbi:MAG: hypothetical protein J1F71_01800 [Clostridiales bacterium]|nr:hypothetical protein [Clostridiales bacterium]
MNVKIKAFLNFILACFFLVIAAFVFDGEVKNCAYMTFLSHAATGLVMLIGGLRLAIKKRDIAQFWYLACAVLMTSVVIACAVFAPELCFRGVSKLPHIVSPTATLAHFLLLCDGREIKRAQLFATIVFPTAYYIFMCVMAASGTPVYVQFDPSAMSALYLAVIGVLADAALLLAAFVLLKINTLSRSAIGRAIHARRTEPQ